VTVQPHAPLAVSTQVGPAVVPSAHIIVGASGPGPGHFSGGQVGGGAFGTQVQTEGELSKVLVVVQRTFWTQLQMPAQSAPPAAGSQLSLGSSTQRPNPGHGFPVNPPHATFAPMHLPVAGSQAEPAGQSTAAQALVVMHLPVAGSQVEPAGQSTAAQALGGGLHLQVGQPLASATLPYWQ
jgi:hypothetical protein